MISSTAKQKQQGTALTWVVSLFLIFMMAALVVDAGRVYYEKKQLQTAANTVATQLAGSGQACFGVELASGATDLTAQAQAILDDTSSGFNNRGFIADSAMAVSVDSSGGSFSASAVQLDARESNGVAVSLSKPVTGLLAFVADDDLHAHAVVRKEVTATFVSTSSTLMAGGGDSLLAGLLEQILPGVAPLDPTDLDNLRNATVTLGELLAAAGVDDVAALTGLNAQDLAAALQTVGGLPAPAATFLQAALDDAGITDVPLTDVLAVVENSSAPDNSEFPLYDTLISLALNLADSVYSLPVTSVSIPGLANLTVDLTVNQAPSVLVGEARWDPDVDDWAHKAKGADVELEIGLLLSLPSVLGIPLGNLDVPLTVSTGSSELALSAASCAQGASQTVDFTVDASVSGVSLGGVIDAQIAGGLLGVTGVVNADVASSDDGKLLFTAELLQNDEPRTPADGYWVAQQLSNTGGVDLAVNDLDVELLGIGLPILPGLVEAAINSLLGPALDGLADDLLLPLLSALGVELGTVTVNLADARQGSMTLLECSQALCADL